MSIKCSYCGGPLVKVNGGEIYKNSHDYDDKYFWKCAGTCDAYVGCDPYGKPLGYPANKQLRHARNQAHHWFDGYWEQMGWLRTDAYKWLQEKMGLSKSKCHIAMFDLRQCEQVINIVKLEKGIPVQGELPLACNN